MKKAKKMISLLCTICMLTGLLSACGASEPTPPAVSETPVASTPAPDPAKTYRETVRVATISDIPSPAYYTNTTVQSAYVVNATHECLTSYDFAAGELNYQIAKEITDVNGDGLTWKITLNEGITFHDEKGATYAELTAEDVAFTLGYVSPKATPKQPRTITAASYVENIDIENDYTLTVTLNMAVYDFPYHVYNIYILCKDAIENFGDEVGQQYGTGPYYLNHDLTQTGIKFTLSRYEEYRNVADYASKNIEFQVIGDLNTIKNALLAGEVDVSHELSNVSVADLESAGYQINSVPSTSCYFVMFNGYDTGKFADFDNPDTVKLRQAIQYAIDKDTLVQILFSHNLSAGTRLDNVFSDFVPGYKDVGQSEFNIEKGRALMTELGYSEANPCELVLAHTASNNTYANCLQNFLEQIYIKVVDYTIDSSAFGATLRTGEGWDLVVNYTAASPSMIDTLTKYLRTGGSTAAIYGLSSEEMDAKIAELLALPTYEDQIEAFGPMQDYVFETVPFIVTYAPSNIWVAAPNVEGAVPSPHRNFGNYAGLRVAE